ncbi:MAG: helix-turn-helix domain-containing protein [Isosphaeraceae bacterium]
MIGERLRQSIQEGSLSQAELARGTGLSEGQISRFLSGERGLSLESIDKLLDVLELEIVIRPRRKARKDG